MESGAAGYGPGRRRKLDGNLYRDSVGDNCAVCAGFCGAELLRGGDTDDQ